MNASELEHQIENYITNHSGLDQRRDYLGMSKIGNCPLVSYREYFDGITLSEQTHRMCYTGYEQETNILVMLVGMGIAKLVSDDRKEVVAKFDPRLRGHIDALTCEDDLLEVKSVSLRKFSQIAESRRALGKHYVQVQLYMLYGNWTKTFMVYRCRETYEHLVLQIPFRATMAHTFQDKARKLLAHIDSQVPPLCECGKCR